MDSTLSSSANNSSLDSSLIDNFGIASLIVVLGVSLSWFVLKMNSGSTSLALPAIPALALTVGVAATSADEDLTPMQRAEMAFAAGNIGEPAQASALYFYQQAIAAEPNNAEAVDGLSRVASHLLGTAESSVFRNDWSDARAYTNLVLAALPSHEQAQGLLVRIERYQRVETLLSLATVQVSESRLTTPGGNNALGTYRRILTLDPGNEAATQGIESIAQRLLAGAQTAAFAGDTARAGRLVEKVRAFAPNHSGVQETEKLSKQWTRISSDQSARVELLAAAKALREDKLVAPKGDNALALFRGVLAKDPASEAATRGLDLVAKELISRAWTQIRGQDLSGAAQAVADAKLAGAQESSLAELTGEIRYQNRLANARLGRIELQLAVSKLTNISQISPEYPKRAASKGITGWASVEFIVSPEGDVVEANLIESSNDLFDRAALEAIKKWRFEPYLQEGRAVPVKSGVRFSFEPS
jgi:TonB family protein